MLGNKKEEKPSNDYSAHLAVLSDTLDSMNRKMDAMGKKLLAAPETKLNMLTLSPAPVMFDNKGYKYYGLICSAAQNLNISINGMSYVVALVAGFNDIPLIQGSALSVAAGTVTMVEVYSDHMESLGTITNQIVGAQRVFAFSTITLLGANAVYTSPTIDGINYKTFRGSIYSDQVGSYIIQHSDDGVAWYNQTSTSITASAFNGVGVNFSGRYIRAVFTNGVTAQTNFHFSAYLEPI